MIPRALAASLTLTLFACGLETGASAPAPAPAAAPVPAPAPATAPAIDRAPYPVVLLHGMGGFDKLQNLPIDVVYFNGVIDDLAKVGETQVFTTVAPPYATSEARAKVIAAQIDDVLAKTHAAKVNLIGHSQGGLDARVLASPNGLALGDRIASVTTIATPHLGSLVADAALGLIDGLPQGAVDQLAQDLLGVLERAVYELQSDTDLRAQVNELSQSYMLGTFNPKYTDDPRVRYSSYAGRTNLETGESECSVGAFADDPSRVDVTQPALYATAVFLEGGASKTPNDGLVTVRSARWGTFLQCVPADHLKEVGQLLQQTSGTRLTFDHLAFFRTVVKRIRDQGL